MSDTSNRAGTIARLGAKLLIALSLVVVVPTGARAQGIPGLVHQDRGHPANDAGLGGANCVGMSDLGTVIVIFAPAGLSPYQLWRGTVSRLLRSRRASPVLAPPSMILTRLPITPREPRVQWCEAREEQRWNADNTGTFGHDTVPV